MSGLLAGARHSTTENTGVGRTWAVVVGAGMAAARLASVVVARGGDVTLLGDEDHAPYNRILLSAVLEGSHDEAALKLGIR